MTGSDSPGRAAAAVLAVASVLVLVTSFSGGASAGWILALSSIWIPVTLILLATGRTPRRRRVRSSVLALGLVMTLSAVTVLLLPVGNADGVHWLGLPLSTLVMLVGLGLGPLVLVLWSYTTTFDERGHDS